MLGGSIKFDSSRTMTGHGTHKSRGTFLRMKRLIQSQQQLAKTLTFIFISFRNKRHPQAEQTVSYKPPAHKAAISSSDAQGITVLFCYYRFTS